MSVLLNHQGTVLADAYTLLADDAMLPESGAVIVSLARWQAANDALTTRTAPIAVKLPNVADVLTLDSSALALPMLVLDFPSFADGRAYSQATQLRLRLKYNGTLRASGEAVVADQLHMMLRCGFTEFTLRQDQDQASCKTRLHPQLGELQLTAARRA